ncbi:MAG: hypothetical protein U9P00_09155 [Pseudomonadota bacterium]|nr:hypothetical protein [Pseudomonadota bacterium]
MNYADVLPNAGSLYQYVVYGTPVGDFLTAVICNDLFEAFGRADDLNTEHMQYYCKFLYNNVPSQCFGSKTNMEYWLENKGIKGLNGKEPSFDDVMTGQADY